MIELQRERIESYLKRRFGDDARLIRTGEIGSLDEQGMKGFGYGKPLLVSFEHEGRELEAVFSIMKGDQYGHQFYWDRAAILMFQYETSCTLDKHVCPLGLGYINNSGELISVDEPREFFIVNEKLPGHDYFLDLERIRGGEFRDSDLELAREFARWLAGVHATKKKDPALYFRRIRNLIGSSECILGLVDEAYPLPYADFPRDGFIALEKRLVDWRWKLREFSHRLSAVHGDFHPWNVLIDAGEFRVLDRSRGEWGEPGGDVASMAMNYLLWSLREYGVLAGPYGDLYRSFMGTYVEITGDQEMFRVMAPFVVFRALVVASPEWYPDHPDAVRRSLFNLMENVLEDDIFDWRNINRYLD